MRPIRSILQYNTEPKDGVAAPSPYDKTADVWWMDRGAEEAQAWAGLFTHVLMPPPTEGSGYGGGYDPKIHYSIKNRFADSRRGWQRFCAVMNRNDIDVLVDAVLAHMDGGLENGYEYHFQTPWGKPYRFQKDSRCFVDTPIKAHQDGIKRDNVLSPLGDFAGMFGRQLSHQNGFYGDGLGLNQRGYVLRNFMDWLVWITDAFGATGLRIDNMKSMSAAVLYYYMTHFKREMWAVAEFYDGNPDTLGWAVFNSGLLGKVSVFDFNRYFWLRDLCNSWGNRDMRGLKRNGFVRRSPLNAVLFPENHDTDTGGNPIIWNKETAYAICCTDEGVCCTYYKDYTDRGGYSLGNACIKNLLWQRYWFGNGPTVTRADGQHFAIYERLDWPGWIIGINTSNSSMDVDIATAFGPNVHYHDYSGHSWDGWTNGNGRATIHLPPGMKHFVTFARDGYQGKDIPINERAAEQVFEGSADLDISPATKTGALTMELWCDKGSPVSLDKKMGEGVRFSLVDASGNEIIPKGNWKGETKQKGFHSLIAHSPTDTQVRYKVATEYWAPRGL